MSRHNDNGYPALLIMVLIAVVAALAFAQGCASISNGWSSKKEHAPLLEQIVRMRTGHAGLTHQTCLATDWWGKCTDFNLIEYDMRDAATRARFVSLGFVCELGGRRYKIDPDAPQLVRYQRTRSWFLAPEVVQKVEPVPFSATQKLLDAALVCYSERTYPSGLH